VDIPSLTEGFYYQRPALQNEARGPKEQGSSVARAMSGRQCLPACEGCRLHRVSYVAIVEEI
jgi:hypothetical protein